MTHGMLASQSCLLADIVGQLHKDSKKINSVDRLSKHLEKESHPFSIFSEIHSAKEEDFTSMNDITFSAMDSSAMNSNEAAIRKETIIKFLLLYIIRYDILL